MRFTTTELVNGTILVEGTDVRGVTDQEVLDPSFWNQRKLAAQQVEAVALVDAAIEALVAPVNAAIEQANALVAKAELDPLTYVLEGEDQAHQVATSARLHKLDRGSIVLRAIDEGQEDRLIWINHQLVLTAAPVAPVRPVFTGPGESPSPDGVIELG